MSCQSPVPLYKHCSAGSSVQPWQLISICTTGWMTGRGGESYGCDRETWAAVHHSLVNSTQNTQRQQQDIGQGTLFKLSPAQGKPEHASHHSIFRKMARWVKARLVASYSSSGWCFPLLSSNVAALPALATKGLCARPESLLCFAS